MCVATHIIANCVLENNTKSLVPSPNNMALYDFLSDYPQVKITLEGLNKNRTDRILTKDVNKLKTMMLPRLCRRA